MEWLLVAAAAIIWTIYRAFRKQEGRQPDVPIRRNRASESAHREPSVLVGRGDPSAQLERTPDDARWVQPGEKVRVGGIEITSGMFYLGRGLRAPNSGRTDNCLVDPSLKVALSGNDSAGTAMSYWPSYSGIQPIARRTYLAWLAAGRNDSSIGIGYVFLFFYGLERRLFVDKAVLEAPLIIKEVERLLMLHGENRSFQSYASRFLDAARLADGSISKPDPSPALRGSYELPLGVRAWLGRKVAASEPLDAEDALAWVLAFPGTSLRTPAIRCFDEFKVLWSARFLERHPEGLRVKPPKKRLKVSYVPASATFEATIELSNDRGVLPDVGALSAPVEALWKLIDSCTEDLAQYSRLLGKNPESRGTAEAVMLLPRELLDPTSGFASSVVSSLDKAFGERSVAPMTVRKLLGILGLRHEGGKIGAAMCGQIGAFLDKMDIGYEPDRRYGSRNLAPDGYVLLFKAAGGAPVDPGDVSYASAKVLTEIGALAAAADAEIAPAEYEAMKADIRSFPGLSGLQRARLIAYAAVLLKDAPARQAAMQRLKNVSERDRAQAVQSAMSAVLADGHVSPDEVKFLERLFKALGLPVEEVYAALHRGSVLMDEPVAVAAEVTVPGVPVPREKSLEGGVQLDEARIARLRAETLAVSRILGDVFTEDETLPVSPPPAGASASADRFDGLDVAHGQLLSAVLAAGALARDEFEVKARALRLLPDGAIETINDWGFETFEEAILEGEEVIFVPDHAREQLMHREAAE